MGVGALRVDHTIPHKISGMGPLRSLTMTKKNNYELQKTKANLEFQVTL